MGETVQPGRGQGCDEDASALLSVDEARRRIQQLVCPIEGHERLFLREALDRTLAEAVSASSDVPPWANSAMDGYALRASDLPETGQTELTVVGKALAGAPWAGTVGPGECVRIMTGAPMPEGADTVVMQEHVETGDNRVQVGPGHRQGQNVRHAGEDIRAGQTVLETGARLGAAELGLLASVGIAEIDVVRRLRVAFFSSGDELKGLGEPLGPGQIYDSNRYTLFAMLRRLGVDVLDMGVVADQRDAVRTALQQAAGAADVIITSGGVSVGEADYITDTLAELGKVEFWRVAVKPGKPLAIGRVGGAFFFGLPGNPVSAMVTFQQFVRPALEQMMGLTPRPPLELPARTASSLHKSAGRLEYQRGVLGYDANGELVVDTTGLQGSHVLSSMHRANCFIVLPEQSTGARKGEWVQVQPFGETF